MMGLERPVLLADVLVDRCQYGLDSRELPMKVQQQNEDALITTANHIATQLVDVVSAAAGRSLTAVRPPKGWKANTPRADFWANWRAVDNGPAIRLWVTHAGAGGTTNFVVGDCTDVVVAIETTTQSSGPVTWTITSGPNSKSWLLCLSRVSREATHFNYWTVCVCFHCDYAAPTWTFSSGGIIGTDERSSCMFDND